MLNVCVLFFPFILLGDIPEELDIEELKQRAKNGDSKAQTEVGITHMQIGTCTFTCVISIQKD